MIDEWGPWIEDFIDCNPITGSLIWKYRCRKKCISEHEYQRWNTRYAHKPALNCANDHGYLSGRLFGRSILAHHAVWAYVAGRFPESEIDHIDGNTGNNAITNLRLATRSENCRNSARRHDNTSGVTGVNKSGNKWIARIGIGKGRRTIGSFSSFDDAVKARLDAEIELGYSERHGS